MAGEVTFALRGYREVMAAMKQVDKGMQQASRQATIACCRKVKTEVRKNLNGAPRWNHRGAGNGLEAITMGGPEHAPRSGGPGKMTGELREGVGIKMPKVTAAGTYSGGVGVGGNNRHPRNNLKKKLESKYPFFEPGVEKAAGEFLAVYTAAYTRALERRGII